jgi:hypothetical protein
MKSQVIAPGSVTEAETDLFPNTLPSSTLPKITWRYLPFTRPITSLYLARLVLFTTRPILQLTQPKSISSGYLLKVLRLISLVTTKNNLTVNTNFQASTECTA